jgi:hypothetical protein
MMLIPGVIDTLRGRRRAAELQVNGIAGACLRDRGFVRPSCAMLVTLRGKHHCRSMPALSMMPFQRAISAATNCWSSSGELVFTRRPMSSNLG